MKRALKWAGILLVLAVGGWSAWWLIGAQGQKAGLQAWLDQQRANGWQAEASATEVSGYPFDFRLEARDLALADPRTGWAWEAPNWVAESRAAQPTRIRITWPERQVLATPTGRAEITGQALTSLVDLRPGPSMELREVATDIQDLRLTGARGWQAGASALVANIAERPEELGPEHAYDLRFEADTLKLPKEIVAQIDPTGWLRPAIDRVTVLGHAAFDDPLDRTTLEQGRLALRAASIREAGFQWGDMRLVVKGSIIVDDNGFPQGDIRIEADEWRQMVRLAVSSGILNRDLAGDVTRAVEFVTALTGTGDSLALPLGLSGGKIRIGPIAIADAPRLAPPR
ncbi:MAG: DUF2125 domain-containing protein [Pseudomonadota bacterium]